PAPSAPARSRPSHAATSSFQCASRNRMPVSSSSVSLAALDTTRSTGSPASSSAPSTAAAYGVPDAPDTPTTHGRRSVITAAPSTQTLADDEVGEREQEQHDTDDAVGREEGPVDPGQVLRPHDRVLVDQHRGGQRQPEPPQPTEAGQRSVPDE